MLTLIGEGSKSIYTNLGWRGHPSLNESTSIGEGINKENKSQVPTSIKEDKKPKRVDPDQRRHKFNKKSQVLTLVGEDTKGLKVSISIREGIKKFVVPTSVREDTKGLEVPTLIREGIKKSLKCQPRSEKIQRA